MGRYTAPNLPVFEGELALVHEHRSEPRLGRCTGVEEQEYSDPEPDVGWHGGWVVTLGFDDYETGEHFIAGIDDIDGDPLRVKQAVEALEPEE